MFPGQSRSGSCHHQPADGSGSLAGSIGSGGCRRSATTTAVDEEQPEPPASVLTRRRALVPPKIPPYNMDSSEDTEQSVDKETSTRFFFFFNSPSPSALRSRIAFHSRDQSAPFDNRSKDWIGNGSEKRNE